MNRLRTICIRTYDPTQRLCRCVKIEFVCSCSRFSGPAHRGPNYVDPVLVDVPVLVLSRLALLQTHQRTAALLRPWPHLQRVSPHTYAKKQKKQKQRKFFVADHIENNSPKIGGEELNFSPPILSIHFSNTPKIFQVLCESKIPYILLYNCVALQ